MNYEYSYSTGNMSPEAATAIGGAGLAIFGVMMLVMVVFALAMYIYMAVCFMKMAKKTGTPNAWLAWIPIANIILMIQIAKKPLWWIIMFFIPIANLIFGILLWMALAEAMKKPSWIGLLILVPIANIILPGYLAFSKMEGNAQSV
jgi:hypothetical protein